MESKNTGLTYEELSGMSYAEWAKKDLLKYCFETANSLFLYKFRVEFGKEFDGAFLEPIEQIKVIPQEQVLSDRDIKSNQLAVEKLSNYGWDVLHKANKIKDLKDIAPGLVEAKYIEKFGCKPNGALAHTSKSANHKQKSKQTLTNSNLADMRRENINKTLLNKDIQALSNASWDELHKSGKLKDLKDSAPHIYEAKYVERYGCKPNESNKR